MIRSVFFSMCRRNGENQYHRHQRKWEKHVWQANRGGLAIPYIEMDRLYWRSNWQGTPDDEFLADRGFIRTLWQAVTRASRRAWHKQELWPGTGNRESFRRSFLSKDSIIIWTIKTWRSNRKRYEADMQNPQYAHIRFLRITRRQDAERLITSLKSRR